MAKTLALLLLSVGTYGQQIKSKCMQADSRLDSQTFLDAELYLNRKGVKGDGIVYTADLSNLQEAPMAFGEPIFIAEPRQGTARKCIWNSRYNIWVLGDCVNIGKNTKPLDKLANTVCPYDVNKCPTTSGRIPWETHDTGK